MISHAGARLAGGGNDGGPFGPGLPDHARGRRLRRASDVLYRHRRMLRGAAGMFHQGRTLGLLDVAPETAIRRLDAAPPCGRFLIHGSPATAARTALCLAGAGFEIDTALITVAADSAAARRRIDALRAAPPPGPEARVELLGRNSSPSLIHAVQALQMERDLTPMPGWFLRGDECDSVSAAWITPGGAGARSGRSLLARGTPVEARRGPRCDL